MNTHHIWMSHPCGTTVMTASTLFTASRGCSLVHGSHRGNVFTRILNAIHEPTARLSSNVGNVGCGVRCIHKELSELIKRTRCHRPVRPIGLRNLVHDLAVHRLPSTVMVRRPLEPPWLGVGIHYKRTQGVRQRSTVLRVACHRRLRGRALVSGRSTARSKSSNFFRLSSGTGIHMGWHADHCTMVSFNHG